MKKHLRNGVYTLSMSAFNLLAATVSTALYFLHKASYNVLKPDGFFRQFSPLHIIWAVWIFGIAVKFLPVKALHAPGCERLFSTSYRPTGVKPEGKAYNSFRRKARYQALLMALLWFGCVCICGGLAAGGFLTRELLFLLCAWLYVFDNFFLSLDCPFRVLIMKNRCCKTCRIHDWDRLMTLSPLFFVPGFYSLSLIVPAAALLILWEITYIRHPERFWEGSNRALHCSECTDRVCEDYILNK